MHSKISYCFIFYFNLYKYKILKFEIKTVMRMYDEKDYKILCQNQMPSMPIFPFHCLLRICLFIFSISTKFSKLNLTQATRQTREHFLNFVISTNNNNYAANALTQMYYNAKLFLTPYFKMHELLTHPVANRIHF